MGRWSPLALGLAGRDKPNHVAGDRGNMAHATDSPLGPARLPVLVGC